MKKITNLIFSKIGFATSFSVVLATILLSSCKDETGVFTPSNGVPSITKVYFLDTLKVHRDSNIVSSEPYKKVVINGKNIGGATELTINDYKIYFNPTYNTDTDLIFDIPGEVPTEGKISNKLKLVTTHGETSFDFKILAKPVMYGTNKITFGTGRGNITISGKNFADVTTVTLTKGAKPVKIVSRTAKDAKGVETITLEFPQTDVGQSTIDITNSSGKVTPKDYTFVNADVAIPFYTDSFGSGFNGDSWGDPIVENTDLNNVYAGTKSAAFTFSGGGWKWIGFVNWWPRLPYSADHKYISFSIKGGDAAVDLWITSENTKAGFAEFPDKNKITVQPKVWNYYKLAIADIDFWYAGGADLPRFGFRPKGPDKTTTLYFDDVMLIK